VIVGLDTLVLIRVLTGEPQDLARSWNLIGRLRYPWLGSLTRPKKRTSPLALSRMRKRKGRSTLSPRGGGSGLDLDFITTAVAAAASVPFWSTRTKPL
jgi:hypothetical protein